MKKRELLERIEQLERRIQALESPPVYAPYTARCDCYDPWWSTMPKPPCPVHGHPQTITSVGSGFASGYVCLNPENMAGFILPEGENIQ